MKPVIVSDHALLRWMERRHGVDVEAFRAELEARARPLAEVCAAGGWVDGVYVVFADGGTIRTVLPNAPRLGKQARYDRGGVNGADRWTEPQSWQHRERRRRG